MNRIEDLVRKEDTSITVIVIITFVLRSYRIIVSLSLRVERNGYIKKDIVEKSIDLNKKVFKERQSMALETTN